MGRLTSDMVRLVEEIRQGRADRGNAVAQMKAEVSDMQQGFRSAHANMARSQRLMLRGFVAGLMAKVTELRQEFSEDIQGARKAFFGATSTQPQPGRTHRRG